jgi:hypothetical protein
MPLYTYIVTFEGASYVAQGRRSNFQGFITWFDEALLKSLPGLTPKLKKQLGEKAYSGFVEMPNRKKVWRKTIDLDGKEMIVYAVQTES